MTTPGSRRRPYRLGKREAAVAETRLRILQGAAEAYQDLGIAATSFQEVARRADVAPGTVLNHFATADELVTAVVEHLTDQLALPDPSILDGIADPFARIRITVEAIYGFYSRGDAWGDFFFRERDRSPAVMAGAATVMAALSRLIEAALGDLAGDPRVALIAGSLLDPATRGALLRAGATNESAATHAADLIQTWLQAHSHDGAVEPSGCPNRTTEAASR